MSPIEAHSYFAARTDRGIAGGDVVDIRGVVPVLRGDRIKLLQDRDWWPILMAAAAQLSGMLADCCDDDDLDGAVLQFGLKFDRGKVTRDELIKAATSLAASLYRYGDNDQAHLWQ